MFQAKHCAYFVFTYKCGRNLCKDALHTQLVHKVLLGFKATKSFSTMLPALFGIQALLFHLALANTSLRWHSHASLTSSGGQATCTTGIATVTFTATATHFDLDAFSPLNQYAVTGILQELFEVNSTFVRDRSQGQSTITGPYNIAATLCSASDADLDGTTKTIQMLSHGLGYDRSYWDVGPGYSYVDAAVSRGYAILAYDRLGAGNSDHPDPVNVVQPPIHVEVLHALIQGLKAGSFTGPEYDNVVSVGHSYGSTIQLALTGKYPGDCDAVIPTGVGSNFNYLASALLSNDATIANTVDNRFTELGNGYLITPTVTAYQRPFFRYPYFDPRGTQPD